MINHVRTLLVNLDGAGLDMSFPGAEYVDPAYRAKTLPSGLQSVWDVIFGSRADRLARYIRARQLLQLLENTELQPYVTALDPRITYDFAANQSLRDNLDRTRITQLDGVAMELTVSGPAPEATSAGVCWRMWQLLLDSTTTGAIQRLHPDWEIADVSYSVSGELSSEISLIGSRMLARVRNPYGAISMPNPRWQIETFASPTKDVGQLITPLETVAGLSAIQNLFGVPAVEPYLTFRNLWERHDQLAYRLGGLVLALAYRIDELPRI